MFYYVMEGTSLMYLPRKFRTLHNLSYGQWLRLVKIKFLFHMRCKLRSSGSKSAACLTSLINPTSFRCALYSMSAYIVFSIAFVPTNSLEKTNADRVNDTQKAKHVFIARKMSHSVKTLACDSDTVSWDQAATDILLVLCWIILFFCSPFKAATCLLF